MPDTQQLTVGKVFLRWFLTGFLGTCCLFFVESVFAFQADTPVTPDASPEAQSLLAFFSDIYGKNILSGQQDGWHGTNESGFELTYLRTNTGKLPAILGLDLSSVTLSESHHNERHDVVDRAIDWSRRNGIVTICWHWHAPIGKRAFYSKDTDFDLLRGLIEGTAEHEGILRDIDAVAVELKLLQDAHVPVLWRPLHEMNGRWFWWGAQGAEPCRRLWQLMFDRLTVHHQLSNLIWVWSPGASIDLADWYPGDAYVDIVGVDHYPMDGSHRSAKDIYDELVSFTRSAKLVGMSENGPIPDMDQVVNEKADWLFFVTWAGTILTERNTKEQLSHAFNHPRVLNLGDLPDLKSYPFKSASGAAKLIFPSTPGNVAINGTRRSPFTVLVKDSAGRTVRSGSIPVTLSLKEISEKLKLAGTLVQRTINGVATFDDVRLNAAAESCSFSASTPGLQNATSRIFRCGPGDGLNREWWLNAKAIRLVDLDETAIPPTGREHLSKAFEVPFTEVTNYVARFRGWLLPPMNGGYLFSMTSEGISELWLSSDASRSNCVQIALIDGKTPYAKWPHTKQTFSKVIQLEAGKRYFIEVLQKQNAGSAHISLSWQLPDGTEERPIPAEHFAAFNDGPTAFSKR